jgi:hypothetical protein
MNKHLNGYRVTAVAAIICVVLLSAGVTSSVAQEMVVEQAAISVDVIDREPVDPGNAFPASVAKLYCYTKIAGAESLSDITHVWYYGDTERARITLAVNGNPWRTYSSKRLQLYEVGLWHVDILDAIGNTMETVKFDITP